MNDQPTPGGVDDLERVSSVLAVLAHPRRRQLVSFLSEHASPTGLRDLATAFTDFERVDTDDDESPVTSREFSSSPATASLVVSLHHVHLPKLAAHGLVEYDFDSRTVDPTPLHGDARLASLLTVVDGLGDDLNETQVRVLTSEVARTTMAILLEAETERSVSLLAADLTDLLDGSRRHHSVRLRHHLLPKLSEVGLVDYDPADSTVSIRGDAGLFDSSLSTVQP
jgi:DNA-binding transcriptional ArsR family regulator